MPELRRGAASELMGSSEQDEAFALEPPSVGGMTITNLLPGLLRAKWLIIGAFVLVSGVTVPIIWMTQDPVFEATALVRVAPVVSRIVFKTDENAIPFYTSYLNTEVSIIRSEKVLKRVLQREDVRQTSWYAERFSAETALLRSFGPQALEGALIVKHRKNTDLIEISMAGPEPRAVAAIANAVMEEYLRVSEESLEDIEARLNRTLREERRVLENERKELSTAKYDLLASLGRVDSEGVQTSLYAELLSLEAQRESLRRESVLGEFDLQRMRGAGEKISLPNESADKRLDPEPSYSEDPEWRQINLDLRMRHNDLEAARQQLGDQHPRILQLVLGVEQSEQLLCEREGQLDSLGQIVPGLVGVASGRGFAEGDPVNLERLLKRQARELDLRQSEIDALEARIAEAGDLSLKRAHYDEEILHSRELLDAVRRRQDVLEMESKAPARISVASLAAEPAAPIRDRRIKLSAAAIAGALFAGLAAAMLFTKVDPKIYEECDVRSTCCAPFLGQLPSLQNGLDLLADCTPMLIEGIRMVRTALLRRLGPSGRHVILVTSSSSRSGKTSVAILLARSLAMLGKKTLLVEADLRRPSLSRRTESKPSAGFASLLTGQAKEENVIVPSGIADFDMLAAGECPAGFNAELLANGVFSSCLKRWKQRYDFVILDSPPVLPVADARILAGQADGTIMVLRASHTRRMEVIQAYADLSAAGGRLIGTILVGVDSLSDGGYYSDYSAEMPRLESNEIAVSAAST